MNNRKNFNELTGQNNSCPSNNNQETLTSQAKRIAHKETKMSGISAPTTECFALDNPDPVFVKAEINSIKPVIIASNNEKEANTIFNNRNFIEQKKEKQYSIDFYDKIKIDFIKNTDIRICCRFLNISSPDQVKSYPYTSPPLINFIHMENIIRFMKDKGYFFAGELNFSEEGNSIPVEKTVWKINNKEICFTILGFLYFRKNDSKTDKNNVVFYLYNNTGHGVSCINCSTNSMSKSEKLIKELKKYTQSNNCLRGSKLRDINIYEATFVELEKKDKYNYDNYYYDNDIKDILDIEVFGFLKNIKLYNSKEIYKRGLMLFGSAGSGKSTLGHIICNCLPDHTVIWITPEIIAENNSRNYSSIKLLYQFAELVSPSIIILEDLDLFSNDRENGGDLLRLGALMNVLDGVNSINNCVTIATTNRLEVIEKALRNRPGRFDRVIEISYLNDELREKMLKNRLSTWNISEEVLKHLVKNTDKWTGAEVQEFINTLNLQQIKDNNNSKEITKETVEKIIEMMKKFSGGEKIGSSFGFNRKE